MVPRPAASVGLVSAQSACHAHSAEIHAGVGEGEGGNWGAVSEFAGKHKPRRCISCQDR